MALIDDILNPINATMEANLSWLTTAYGKVQILKKEQNKRIVSYPGLFNGDADATNRYIDLRPDSSLGNYCFWEITDDQSYHVHAQIARVNFRFKLIFWWHWPTVYPSDWRSRSIEEIKREILAVLAVAQYTNVVDVFTIHESADRIFSSYDVDEIDDQFMMREYGGLAIEGEIFGQSGCNLSSQAPTIPPNLYGSLPFNYTTSEQLYPLAKWLGNRVYCRVFDLGVGANAYVPLTGLTVAGVEDILPMSCVSGMITATGKRFTSAIEYSHDAGVYEVFAATGTSRNYVTVYYTKP